MWGVCEDIKVKVWCDIRYSFNSSMEKLTRKKSVEEIVEGAVDNIFEKYD